HGLGARVGGVVTGPGGAFAEVTAERYLVHGLAAGSNCLALYDSDLCLHIVSLASILESGRVSTAPPPTPDSVAARWTSEVPTPMTAVASESGLSPYGPHDLFATTGKPSRGMHDDEKTTVSPVDRSNALKETSLESITDRLFPQASSSSRAPRMVALVNNDHGLVQAEVVSRQCAGPAEEHNGYPHRGPENDQFQGPDSDPFRYPISFSQEEEGLGLSITWRDAHTRLETPDNGECCAAAGEGSGAGARPLRAKRVGRLPFLPAFQNEVDQDNNDGVIAA
ncbi:unnamed protein product, partial [Sphacelaria rigidula]